MFEVIFEDKIIFSPSGNRTPVSRVTGGDTDHYTNEEHEMNIFQMVSEKQRNMWTELKQYIIILTPRPKSKL